MAEQTLGQTPGKQAERKAFVAAVHAQYGDFDNAMEVAFETEGDEKFAFALWQAGKEYGIEMERREMQAERREPFPGRVSPRRSEP